jgi:thioredoxin 1
MYISIDKKYCKIYMPVLTLKTKDDLTILLGQDKLLLLDFTAAWCGPCQRMVPVLETLSSKYINTLIIKVDVDEHSEIAEYFKVSAMPTFVFIKNREVVERVCGADAKKLEEAITKLN